MEKLRTVRGVHDLLPNDLHNHNEVINAGLEISDKYNYSKKNKNSTCILYFSSRRH